MYCFEDDDAKSYLDMHQLHLRNYSKLFQAWKSSRKDFLSEKQELVKAAVLPKSFQGTRPHLTSTLIAVSINWGVLSAGVSNNHEVQRACFRNGSVRYVCLVVVCCVIAPFVSWLHGRRFHRRFTGFLGFPPQDNPKP